MKFYIVVLIRDNIGASNDKPQCMFSWRNKKNVTWIVHVSPLIWSCEPGQLVQSHKVTNLDVQSPEDSGEDIDGSRDCSPGFTADRKRWTWISLRTHNVTKLLAFNLYQVCMKF